MNDPTMADLTLDHSRCPIVELRCHDLGRGDRVSPAFIKELMRRSMQFHLERSDGGLLELVDVESAIEEMLFSGGSLNAKLLGAAVDQGESRSCDG